MAQSDTFVDLTEGNPSSQDAYPLSVPSLSDPRSPDSRRSPLAVATSSPDVQNTSRASARRLRSAASAPRRRRRLNSDYSDPPVAPSNLNVVVDEPLQVRSQPSALPPPRTVNPTRPTRSLARRRNNNGGNTDSNSNNNDDDDLQIISSRAPSISDAVREPNSARSRGLQGPTRAAHRDHSSRHFARSHGLLRSLSNFRFPANLYDFFFLSHQEDDPYVDPSYAESFDFSPIFDDMEDLAGPVYPIPPDTGGYTGRGPRRGAKKYAIRMSHNIQPSADPHRKGNRRGWSRDLLPLPEDSTQSTATLENKQRSNNSFKKPRQPSMPICTDCLRPLVIGAPPSRSLPITLDLTDPDLDSDPDSSRQDVDSQRLKLTLEVGRPWALACGHVVCTQCFQAAKARCYSKKRRIDRHVKSQKQIDLDDEGQSPSTSNHRSMLTSDDVFDIVEDPLASKASNEDEVRNHTNTLIPRSLREQKSTETKTAPSKRPNENSSRKKGEYTATNYEPTPQWVQTRSDPHVNHTWVQCPVWKCDGAEGDLLAEPDANGPWELYV